MFYYNIYYIIKLYVDIIKNNVNIIKNIIKFLYIKK